MKDDVFLAKVDAAHELAAEISRRKHLEAHIEIIYGLLWCVPVDKATPAGIAVSLARKTALEMIDKEGQKRGIAIAKRAVRGKYLQSTVNMPTINPRSG